MTVLQLTSKDNALLKDIRIVSAGARRAPKDLVVAEGLRVVEEAEQSRSDFEAVVFSESFGSASREKDLIDRLSSSNVRLYQVSEGLFKSVSTVQAPQGVIALVRVPELTLDSVPVANNNALILCACGIQDPGNLGTLVRTSAAAGATLVCTAEGTVSTRNPKAIRSSAGCFFRIPVVEHLPVSEFVRYCGRHSVRLYRTDARKGVIYTEADLKSGCALLLGNEGSGLTQEEFSGLESIRIPIEERVESLNVATAGAVLLFEARRQRSF